MPPLAEEGIQNETVEDGYGTARAGDEVWKYEYDRQGNLLKDNHAEYSYDGFNRMEKAETFTGKIQVNHYDAEGLCYEMEENGRLVSFIFRDREVVAEREKESTIRYIRGYDIVCSDSECARMYYHYVCDEGGSTSHVLDETGRVLNQYDYDAFGNLIKVQEEVTNRFLYVGQQYDAVTMQYYLRARYYNPVVARFTQEDTYRGDGLNLYAYCRNNPVGYYDPSGHDTCGDSKSGNGKAQIKTGDKTPRGKEFTEHGAEQASSRGYTTEDVDNIIDNWTQKYYQPGGKTVYIKKNSYGYDVVIVDKNGKSIISVIGGNATKGVVNTLSTMNLVKKMLNNNGGYYSSPV